ncbi:MAG: hypothetical protein AAFU79_34885 [Myxococcota bacterium]
MVSATLDPNDIRLVTLASLHRSEFGARDQDPNLLVTLPLWETLDLMTRCRPKNPCPQEDLSLAAGEEPIDVCACASSDHSKLVVSEYVDCERGYSADIDRHRLALTAS